MVCDKTRIYCIGLQQNSRFVPIKDSLRRKSNVQCVQKRDQKIFYVTLTNSHVSVWLSNFARDIIRYSRIAYCLSIWYKISDLDWL